MAIDRTNYNALVDDDGSGLVGTVWSKDKVKTVILDPVDAAFLPIIGGTLTGHLLFTDNTYDIGASGATRPRNLYVAQGMVFPATQNPSSNANTLDDYEEGTWTPVIGGSGGTTGQTYSARSANYVKVGQLVQVSFRALLSAKGTITGNVQIQGLPFTAASTGGGVGVGGLSIVYFSALGTSWISLTADVGDNTTVAPLYGVSAAATGVTALTGTDISNTTDIRGYGWYRAAA